MTNSARYIEFLKYRYVRGKIGLAELERLIEEELNREARR